MTTGDAAPHHRPWVLDGITVFLLSVTAVLTAWCGLRDYIAERFTPEFRIAFDAWGAAGRGDVGLLGLAAGIGVVCVGLMLTFPVVV